MNAYPLNDLLDVRIIREMQSLTVVANAIASVTSAEEQVAATLLQAEDYHHTRIIEEQKLFFELTRACVALKDLEKYKYTIKVMRIRERDLRQEHSLALKTLEANKQQLVEAQRVSKAAILAKIKLEYHKEGWCCEEAKYQSLMAEKEQEEVQYRRVVI